jgi:hypothetical protein
MGRPDPIEYAERLYGAIRAANFSPLSFLAFGNAVKDGVAMRNMPRIAAEPFMRVVGDMLDLEARATIEDVMDVAPETAAPGTNANASPAQMPCPEEASTEPEEPSPSDVERSVTPTTEKRRSRR